MIEVVIRNGATGQELARVHIRNLETEYTDEADYGVKFVVERGSAVGLHRRRIFSFPRRKYNALALLRQALETLEPEELELERDFNPDEPTDRAPDLAREVGRAGD